MRCYDNAYGSYPLGQSLYVSHLFYSDPTLFFDFSIQNEIRKIEYSLSSGTPMYNTVLETPASVVDQFMIYKHEKKHCEKYIQEENDKKNKGK